MSDDDIPFGRPMLDQEEIDAVVKVLSGPVLVHGPVTKAFEDAFAERAGAAHAISVSSCTAALHLSLFAHDVGPGDEVAVPAFTHVATAHAAEYCRAKPIFVDVEPTSGNMDAALLKEVASERMAAINVVHFLGLPCEMDTINAIAADNGAIVVEDAAIALDGTYDGRKVGTLGTVGCFSFYPVKFITTIEGGMLTTNDDALAASLRQRKAFGYDRMLGERKKPGMYDVTVLGYNYRMNEVQAAVGLTQLTKLDRFQQMRVERFDGLKAILDELDEVTVFEPNQGKARAARYCLNAILPRDGSVDRDAVVAHLTAAGIGTSIHYPRAVPLMGYYREKYGYREGQFPVAEWLAAQTISLPVAPHLSEDDPARIGNAVKDAIAAVKRG